MSDSVKTDIEIPPKFCQYSAGQCDQAFNHIRATDIFTAYSAQPSIIASTIDEAINQLRRSKPNHLWGSWRDLSVSGQIIFCGICKAIRFTKVFVADISVLNFNVLFEIGYAIGLGKPIRLIRDTNYERDAQELEELGTLDTIGYDNYTNSDMIVDIVQSREPQPVTISSPVPELRSSPIYVVLPSIETEGIARLKSALNQSAFQYRTFDANETPRLTFSDLTRHVSSSVAVVLPLLDPSRRGANVHNARCALAAGLAMARGLHVLMLQEGQIRQPIDYRDICQQYSDPRQVQGIVERFVKKVATTITSTGSPISPSHQQRDLEKLDLGDIAAENEDEQLESYFVKTSQFQETARGHARLVVGRKGTGKSAIFSQLRNRYIRRNSEFVVLDIRPEGYQLKKLIELLRTVSDEAIREQLSSTLWYYILLTELARCVLDRDLNIAYRDPDTLERYQSLGKCYEEHATEDGDFSDRLEALISRIQERFSTIQTTITSSDVNESIWSGDLKPLTETLGKYLHYKNEVWILVDNLDKSWPPMGATAHEILVLRCLLEASRKLQRHLERLRAPSRTVLFIRNDIFERLISDSSDRGKDSYVNLDQSDPEVLREIIRLRAVASLGTPMTFDEFARRFFDLHVGGEDTFRFLFRHTFGRARDVLRIVKRCVEMALNRGHIRVSEDDILSAIKAHSEDVLKELKYEIRDSHGVGADVLEEFIGAPQFISNTEIDARIAKISLDGGNQKEIREMLLWYSFLGVQNNDGSESYAYEEHYNIERLLRRGVIGREEVLFVVHPAFRAALHIEQI